MALEESKYYESYDKFYLSVDCIVFALYEGSLKLLLINRKFEPHKGEWSLMGGFVERGESVDDAARRVLRDLTGLDGIYMHQIGTFGEIDRDPGERVISVAYSALLNFPDLDHDMLKEHNAFWVDFKDVPELICDHNAMIEKAISKMQHKMRVEPLAFQLLPEHFTLTQLQQLYETLLGYTIDKRNFRRRALENKCIVATEMMDKESSRRGARLYVYKPNDMKEAESFKI